MPPTATDVRDDIRRIEDALGGEDGIRVRMARLDGRLEGLEGQLETHQRASAERDTATQTMVRELAAKVDALQKPPAPPPATPWWPPDRTVVGIGVGIGIGLATALGLGAAAVGGTSAASQPTAPAAAPDGEP